MHIHVHMTRTCTCAYMYMYYYDILSSGLSINSPYACIPVSVLLTYMYHASIHATDWLLFPLPPPLLQWEMRIRMKTVTMTIKRMRYHNGTFLMHTHTCTVIQRRDYMYICFYLHVTALIVRACVCSTNCVRNLPNLLILKTRYPIEIVVWL